MVLAAAPEASVSAGQRDQLGRRDKGGPAWRLRCRPRHVGLWSYQCQVRQ